MKTDEILEEIATAAPGEIPVIVGELERLKAVAYARLTAPQPVKTEAPDTDRLVDFAEAGQILGIPEDRARDLGRAGDLAVIRIGKYRRVRLSAVLAYAAAHEEPAHRPAKRR